MALTLPRHLSRMLALAGLAIMFLLAASRPTRASLYEDLGGAPVVQRIAENFVDHVTSDTRANKYFVHADKAAVKLLVAQQLTAASGGPGVYDGNSIVAGYRGLHMTEAAFNAIIGDLVGALIDNQVPYHRQNRVLAILTPLANSVTE